MAKTAIKSMIYPQNLFLKSLDRRIKLGQKISLNSLNKKEVQNLISEIRTRNLLVEVAGQEGILKEVFFYTQFGFQHVTADLVQKMKIHKTTYSGELIALNEGGSLKELFALVWYPRPLMPDCFKALVRMIA